MKIQRVYQVSTSPEVMNTLMEKNLTSAYTIANIPQKSFIKRYALDLGGYNNAFAIHQRASFISTRAEMVAMHCREYSHGLMNRSIMDEQEFDTGKLLFHFGYFVDERPPGSARILGRDKSHFR